VLGFIKELEYLMYSQKYLPMTMAMKRNIEEGDIITIFMAIDLTLMEIDITVKMDITKRPRLNFLL